MNMTLGADPEFVFVGKSGLVPASDYFVRQDNHNGRNPEIGGDGHPATAELRTPVCGSPLELVDSVQDILFRRWEDIPPELSWVAGSFIYGKSLGGHIHFGGITMTDEIVGACDGIVAQTLLLVEDKRGARARRAGQYGQLGDVREKPWGFEYRTLPSWLISRDLALAVVGLTTAAVYEEVTQGKQRLRKLRPAKLRTVAHVPQSRFRECDKGYFEPKWPDLYKHIRSLSYWKTEEGEDLVRYIRLLDEIIRSGQDWHTGEDILHRWGIRETPVIYPVNRDRDAPRPENALEPDEAWDEILVPGGV